ncbi:ATP-dependent nuclease [Winogradskyella aquimaris]|uniref:AAA family ATPase n=1 Tax=Winogradskyella aquimaris TaxID=864074 RepID=A0ABU5EPI8_9FLAO|nr:AAA family ATPase [Winogradskyella aquimaris]MDY2586786.1 AAA family ATPase [Winogradskyella aquimaris]
MKLDKVRIEEFKSIKALTVDLHELTCFVGKNESGKSAILEAISYLNFTKYKLKIDLTNKTSSKYERDEFPIIKGYFLISEEESEMIYNLFTHKATGHEETKKIFKWLRVTIKSDKIEDIEFELLHGNNKGTSLKEIFNSSSGNTLNAQQKLNQLNVNRNKIFNEVIPQIELFTSDELTLAPITLAQYQQKQGSYQSFKRLFEIANLNNIETLAANPQKFRHKLRMAERVLTKILRKAYKQDDSLEVKLDYHGDKFIISFEDDSDRPYDLTERSLGFQYFFAFLINKTYFNKIDKRKHIFLLDEPGNNLHPEGARNLVNVLEDIAETDQVLYSTHNPFLAFRKKPDNLILVKKSGTKGTELLTKVYTNKYQILRKELGLILNDSFLVNDINLVVEGNADKWILHYVIHEDDDFEPLTWTHIFSADTASEIIPSVRYLSNLGLKGVVLLDSDDAGNKEIKKPKFKKYILEPKEWSHLTLDEVFNDGEKRTIEDMLLHQKYVEAYNEYYKEEDAVEWNEPFKPLVISKYSLPILDQINTHFKQHADGGINKIAILRKFTELNPYDTNMGFYKKLKELLLVIQERVMKLNA